MTLDARGGGSSGSAPRPLFVNPGSGLRDLPEEQIAADFAGFEIREVPGADLEGAVRDAVAEGADVVAVAGGDGSVSTAAGVLAGSGVTLLVVPGGTLNHFAHALGIPDLTVAGEVARHGEVRAVDVGAVNGRVFVNNATVGWYPEMVRTREHWEERVPRTLARVIALTEHLPRVRAFDVEAAGRTDRAWIVWVGNGEMETNPTDLGTRENLADGLLDVWVANAGRSGHRIRQLGALLGGRLEESPVIQRRTTEAITLRFRRPVVSIALDGEVSELRTPLRFEARPEALRVLVPPGSAVTKDDDG